MSNCDVNQILLEHGKRVLVLRPKGQGGRQPQNVLHARFVAG